jgi:hypothetical protein
MEQDSMMSLTRRMGAMTRRSKKSISIAVAALSCSLASGCRLFLKSNAAGGNEFSTLFGSPEGAYLADKKWDEKAEEQFSAWIEQLGREREIGTCQKLGQCLTSRQANSLWSEDDKNLSVFADCTDAPLLLRAYFAFKTKRPFQYVSSVSNERLSQENSPIEFKGFNDYKNINSLLQGISNDVHSGFFRMAPNVENGDTYPIDISVESVRPGTLYYDPNGQVLMVYHVEKNGLVKFLSGHSDNTLTTSPFGERFSRGGPLDGGGFRAWRWMSIETVNADQKRFRLARLPNSQSRFYNPQAQYQNEYTLGNDVKTNYHSWVRSRLANNTAKTKPVQEFHDQIKSLCTDIQQRVHVINAASEKGMTQKSHPGLLPSSIYAATGDWEIFSTPSRDTRIRNAMRGLYRYANNSIVQLGQKNANVEFRGSQRMLAVAFRESWNTMTTQEACQFTYTNSEGKPVLLTLNDIVNRVFDLSFDPYHCPEMRWGAKPARGASVATPDYSTCPRDATKEDWYWKETRLRNTLEHSYGEPTPYDAGTITPEDIHVPNMLNTLITKLSITAAGTSPSSQPSHSDFVTPAITHDGVDLETIHETCSQQPEKQRWECIENRGCEYDGASKRCRVAPHYRKLFDAARAAGRITAANKPFFEEE